MAHKRRQRRIRFVVGRGVRKSLMGLHFQYPFGVTVTQEILDLLVVGSNPRRGATNLDCPLT